MEIICLREFFCDSLFGVVTRGASVSTVLPLKNVVHRTMASILPESLLVIQNLDIHSFPIRHTESEFLGICGLIASLMILIHTISSKLLESLQKIIWSNHSSNKKEKDKILFLWIYQFISALKGKLTINLHPGSHN